MASQDTVQIAKSRVWRQLMSLNHDSSKNGEHILEEAESKLFTLLQSTVEKGESNSALLIGMRGSGKTRTLKRVLDRLKQKNGDFHTVWLNGLVQSDDKSALREIIRQLALERQLNETMSFGSIAETMECLVATLKTGTADSTPIVLILDEFDVYADIPRQTLLYTLFDVAQSSQNPIAVIGSTCRLDVLTDVLEKRVKSRFSHRQIYVHTSPQLADFQQVIKSKLLLQSTGRDSRDWKDYVNEYNIRVEAMFEEEAFNAIVTRIFNLSNDVRLMSRIAFEAMSRLSESEPFPRSQLFNAAAQNQLADGKLQLLQGLSILELCLLVAIKRIVERGKDEFNFEMVYDDYKTLTTKIDLNQGGRDLCFTKPVALKAFEHLVALELVRPTETVTKTIKQFRLYRLLVETDLIRAVGQATSSHVLKSWLNAK